MSTIVLIHGGWHGAWCWHKVVAMLEKQGHRVIAPDLPGHGSDSTAVRSKPYEMYVPTVCALVENLEDRAILVGHSSGGMIITEASRQMGDRIKGLVYLSAFLLSPGKTPREAMKMDSESMLPGCIEINSTKGVSLIKTQCARSVFYEDCSEEDAAWAISQLQPEPLIPAGTASTGIGIDDAPVRVPRFYIECLKDKALGPRCQRWMYTESPCDGVYSLCTSHSPFLSAPEALTGHLLDIVKRLA
ncbi:MAG: alpha/beta fold hydrolase [Bryobacteraceae bacterium]